MSGNDFQVHKFHVLSMCLAFSMYSHPASHIFPFDVEGASSENRAVIANMVRSRRLVTLWEDSGFGEDDVDEGVRPL
jgi:hypothetical protein